MTIVNSTPVASNSQIMWALFKKDWRLFRAPTVALLAVSPGSYLLMATLVFYSDHQMNLLDGLVGGAFYSCLLASLLASAFGGVAIAGERADRTADFMALLPVTRKQIILSKWMASISILGAWMVLQLGVGLSLTVLSAGSDIRQPMHELLGRGGGFAAMLVGYTTSFIGIAWLFSTCTRSAPISACISIAVTIAAISVVAMNDTHPSGEQAELLRISVVPMVLGTLSIIGGTAYYLRRIAP